MLCVRCARAPVHACSCAFLWGWVLELCLGKSVRSFDNHVPSFLMWLSFFFLSRTCEVGDGGAHVSAASAPVAASEPKGDETRIVRYDYIPKASF